MRRLFQFPRRSPAAIRNDVDAELRFHIDTRIDALVSSGLSADEARAQALREFGDFTEARLYMNKLDTRTEAARRRHDYFGDLVQDLAYALRKLRTSPAFALTAIVTLALGVGANAAIFSMVNGVLFRPLPFPEPEQLYKVWSANPTAGNTRAPVSVLDVDDWRARKRTVTDIGGYYFSAASSGADLTGAGSDPQRLSVAYFTPGFFAVLGAPPAHGRLPREEEAVRGGPDDVVVLSHRFWQSRFGGSSGVIDSTLTLGGTPFRVLGVMGPEFAFPSALVDAFVPYSTIPDESIPRIRQVRILDVIARAPSDVPLERVQTELTTITQQLSREYPENTAWTDATVAALHDAVTGNARRGLFVLLGAVGFVLLIACVNVASLQLARAEARGREVAVRMALGAGRGRIVRQLITENALLALAGGAAGLLVAKASLHLLLVLSAGELPRTTEIRLDGAVVALTLGLSVACGLLFGLVPAMLTSSNVQQRLRAGGRGAGGGGNRLRYSLVVTEVALAVVLVAGGTLMTRSFIALLDEDPGFRADHTLAMNFTLSPSRHADYRIAYQRIIEDVRALPGVESAGAVKHAPFRGNGERNSFTIPGMVVPAGQDAPVATVLHVSDGYFATVGARIVEGREFLPTDRAGSPPVLLVNEAFARQWFPGTRVTEQPGLLFGGQTPVPIVGVIGDIRQVSMSEPAQPTIYVHNLQNGRVQTTLVVRTQGDPLAMVDAVRRVVWSVDRLQPITSIFTLDDAVSGALARPRLLTVVLGVFGTLGLLLGAIGLYGVLAYVVQQRQREIGVRLAVGAQPHQVLRMIVTSGLALTLAGVAIGTAGALLAGRYLRDVLYGVPPNDPVTLTLVACTLFVVAALASWIPARRAAAVDPVVTLRAE